MHIAYWHNDYVSAVLCNVYNRKYRLCVDNSRLSRHHKTYRDLVLYFLYTLQYENFVFIVKKAQTSLVNRWSKFYLVLKRIFSHERVYFARKPTLRLNNCSAANNFGLKFATTYKRLIIMNLLKRGAINCGIKNT